MPSPLERLVNLYCRNASLPGAVPLRRANPLNRRDLRTPGCSGPRLSAPGGATSGGEPSARLVLYPKRRPTPSAAARDFKNLRFNKGDDMKTPAFQEGGPAFLRPGVSRRAMLGASTSAMALVPAVALGQTNGPAAAAHSPA